MDSKEKVPSFLIYAIVGLIALIVFGFLYVFLFGKQTDTAVGWYVFSYAMGLTMIVLPCTLPLAFVIVPLSMGKGPIKGIGIALCFGLGVALMLSMYGVLAAIVGKATVGQLNTPLETVKNWVYFVAGIFAYIFALGEIGLVNFRMPSYTGAAPAFIQKQQDYIKAFLLGIFLGNIGVGCPHPATPLILIEIATSQNIFYGWSLFLVHAIGRILPLILLAFLGILGVNALSWLVARKEKLERATGWTMVFVAGFILTLGLFTHAWWVNSGQHTLFEQITGEEFLLGKVIARFGFGGQPHSHGPEMGQGLLGLPLAWGNWVLVILWLIPVWWAYFKKKDEVSAPSSQSQGPITESNQTIK
ncbi:MAG: cytochrome c biogenesis protein CcdA [Patescibacteria group bacterium]